MAFHRNDEQLTFTNKRLFRLTNGLLDCSGLEFLESVAGPYENPLDQHPVSGSMVPYRILAKVNLF